VGLGGRELGQHGDLRGLQGGLPATRAHRCVLASSGALRLSAARAGDSGLLPRLVALP
jgi:hypothetical protein